HIVHHFTIKPVIYGSMAAKAARIPVIINTVTGLGYVFTDQGRAWLSNMVRALYQGAFSVSDHVFFQNNEDKEFLGRNNSRLSRKVTVLPGSGVDCTLFAPKQGPTNSTEKGTTFLMVSRVLKDKGIYEFVEAGRLVKKVYPNTRLKLLGRRDERNPSVVSIKELEQWQSEGVLEWLGEVEDVRPFLSRADVVVLPSYREGTPRSLLEAAAMEKPLIATDVPGCREIVIQGRTGLLVQPKDSRGLAKAMIEMIENPLMRLEMGREARCKVEKEFDETIVIRKILDVYQSLLQTKVS
ncbi:MAG: glycosyltransferase family 1 protein, partial [Thermoplasmata archaeon]